MNSSVVAPVESVLNRDSTTLENDLDQQGTSSSGGNAEIEVWRESDSRNNPSSSRGYDSR